MTAPVVPLPVFVGMVEQYGPSETARRIGVTVRQVYQRRVRAEKVLGRPIKGPDDFRSTRINEDYSGVRLKLKVNDGMVIIGSDSHYMPGDISTAHRAFLHFCKTYKQKLKAVIKNGDEMDGASISRHSPIGWEKRPKLTEEIEAGKDRLGEIEKIIGGACPLYWPLGNHDARFSTRLATVAPEYAQVHGFRLKDHFPFWHPCWGVWINDDIVIKHRFKGGIHATHNNAVASGKSMVTGHLHSLKVTPYTDYNGTRWGIDCGTMMEPGIGEPWGEQAIDYTEDNPLNWRSGFVLLTFIDGELLWPEVVHVVRKGVVSFRGELIKV